MVYEGTDAVTQDERHKKAGRSLHFPGCRGAVLPWRVSCRDRQRNYKLDEKTRVRLNQEQHAAEKNQRIGP
jgi:hypothetical protein